MNQCDANGRLPDDPNSETGKIALGIPYFALIGWVGTDQPISAANHTDTGIASPRFIYMGNYMFNHPVSDTGPLWVACNDNSAGDFGEQVVRIIVTQ